MSKEDDAVETAEAPAKAPYWDRPPAPLLDTSELTKWSTARSSPSSRPPSSSCTKRRHRHRVQEPVVRRGVHGVGFLGVARSFGATIFVLVYCTAVSQPRHIYIYIYIYIYMYIYEFYYGGHINPAVTFGLFVGRKLSLVRTVLYIVAQCLSAICGVGVVKGIMKQPYDTLGGGANTVSDGYSVGGTLAAEIVGTFILVYTVFSATDPNRTARDSFIPVLVLVPLPIGFAVFIVHLATIPITGMGINPARSLGAAVLYDQHKAWKDHWIFWIGPLIGAFVAAVYHKLVLRGEAANALGSFRGTSASTV